MNFTEWLEYQDEYTRGLPLQYQWDMYTDEQGGN